MLPRLLENWLYGNKLYARWMYAWETALTTRDENRVERPLEWGFDHLADVGGEQAAAEVAAGRSTPLAAMIKLNEGIVAAPHSFFDYTTPDDFRIEPRFPELFPTNVRPETLEQEREWKRRAAIGELRRVPFLRFTSPLRTPYPENDTVNARWYEARPRAAGLQGSRPPAAGISGHQANGRPGRQLAVPGGAVGDPTTSGAVGDPTTSGAVGDLTTSGAVGHPATSRAVGEYAAHNRVASSCAPRQAMIVMPQWNADAFSHNVLCEMFNRFGISCLRLSKPYHDVRRPAELERSDYAVSANVGRTIAACRQAVVDIRSCLDWLVAEGYEQIGVLGTSLGSAYAFIAAAMDPRIRVCAFNHASTQFGDVVWTGQSTRHVKAAFEHAGLTQDQVRAMFAGVSPMSYMQQFAAEPTPSPAIRRRTLVVHATYDLTFIERYSLDVLRNFNAHGVDYVSKVLPCGHYTTGETPYKYLDGWYLGSFIWSSFRRLASPGG